MMIFSVMTKLVSQHGVPIGFAVELPFADVAAACDALSDGEFLCGNKLSYADDGRGGKLITGREPFGINPDQVATIAPAKFRFWEPDENRALGAASPLARSGGAPSTAHHPV